jgi:hypothetical protein
MFSKIKKLSIPLTVVALLAVAAPAFAAKGVTYKGKTSSGHKITYKVAGGRVIDLVGGIRMSCIPIQGGGAPVGGSEIFGFKGSVPLKAHNQFKFMSKPAFYWNEVTMTHDLWLKRKTGGVMTGKMRLQYSYMVSKYPIGTFVIYSCLGGATFKAKAAR